MTTESEWHDELIARIAAALGVPTERLAGDDWDYNIIDDDECRPTGVEVRLDGRTVQLGADVVPPLPEE